MEWNETKLNETIRKLNGIIWNKMKWNKWVKIKCYEMVKWIWNEYNQIQWNTIYEIKCSKLE